MSVGARVGLATLALAALALGVGGAAAEVPHFEDVAEDVGIDVYYYGEGEESPPVLYVGGGVCWGDFDGDGFEDLFFTKSTLNNSALRAEHRPMSQVLRNNGDGTFTDVSAGSGAAIESWGLGCSVADYDGDGDLDLFYAAHSASTLFRNDGPFRFTNVTDDAGVSTLGKCAPHMCFSTGSAWRDVGGDGCLDLYVVNYGNTSVGAPNTPETWPGQANIFFENDCDGTFTDRTIERNLDDDPAWNHSRSFQPMWADYDGDGLVDVYVTADGAPNSLLRQRADGVFEEMSWAAGVADTRAGMGLEFDDADGDGWPDIFSTHYAAQHNGFYLNERDGSFRDVSGTGNLSSDFWDLSWGTAFLDLDNDGLKDIYVTNGHTDFIDSIENQSRRMYLQEDGGDWRDISDVAGPGVTMKTTGRGSAWSDYDFDGDLDIVIENLNNQSANLLRNSNVTGNWLEVQLRDSASANRFAVGARVTVDPDGATPASHRVLHAGASFLSQNSYTLHFGLGSADRADVTVRWPDGGTSTYAAVDANRVVRVTRGADALEEDVLAPVTAAAVAGPSRDGWYRGEPEVTLTATDRGVTATSGVQRIEYALDDGPWTEYVGPFAVGEGERVLRYRAHDVAGNLEPYKTAAIRVDATPPTASLDVTAPAVDGWFTELPRVAVHGHDALSGVHEVAASTDGGLWEPIAAPFTLPPGDGARSVRGRVTDVAGHESATATLSFLVDASPPTTRPAYPSGPHLVRGDVVDVTSDTRIALDAHDGAGSGAVETTYRIDGGAWATLAAPLAFSGEDRVIVVDYASRDAVGHEEGVRTQRFRLDDATPPVLRLATPAAGRAYAGDVVVVDARAGAGAAYAAASAALGEPAGFALVAGTVTVSADAGQDVSGVAWMRVLVDGVERHRVADDRLDWTWAASQEPAGWHDLVVEAADGRGNVGASSVRVLVPGAGGTG